MWLWDRRSVGVVSTWGLTVWGYVCGWVGMSVGKWRRNISKERDE